MFLVEKIDIFIKNKKLDATDNYGLSKIYAENNLKKIKHTNYKNIHCWFRKKTKKGY